MNYKNLSSDSRVWIYQSDREFSLEEIQKIKFLGEEFLKSWNSHGTVLQAAFEIFYNRFIAIFVDENHASASGCSIDKSVHFIKQIEKDFSVSLFDRMKIAFKEKEKIFLFHINELSNMLSQKVIHENTIIFNNTVSTKKEFETNWAIPLKNILKQFRYAGLSSD